MLSCDRYPGKTTCGRICLYCKQPKRSWSRKKFAQSHSFLFGISSFFLSPYTGNFNELESYFSLLAFNCQLASQQCFGATLCKKKPQTKQNPFILFSLLLALIKAVSLLLSKYCMFLSVFGVFLVGFWFVVGFFSASQGAVMLFTSWEASGLNLCCSLASVLFVFL